MALREGLLVLLADGARHGYELKTEFEHRTGRIWPINTGQLYTTLERLQRDGLVEPTEPTQPTEPAQPTQPAERREHDGADVRGRERRRPYRLTDQGRDEARTWLSADFDAGAPPRDELIMKVLLAAHSDLGEAHAVVDTHRRRLLAQMQRLRHRQRQQEADTLASRLCNDALVVRIEADLRWLDMCTERLAAEAEADAEPEADTKTVTARRPRATRGSRGRR